MLARGQNEFKITKFALSDDEIDYNLWDVAHPNGTDYYGQAIENMPLLEAISDENQVMRYKLITMPKSTAKLPIMGSIPAALTFTSGGEILTVTPTTRNGSDDVFGYTFIIHDASVAGMDLSSTSVQSSGATIPFFLSEEDRKNSITLVGKSVNVRSLELTIAGTTQLTIVGNQSGATATVPVTVPAGVG